MANQTPKEQDPIAQLVGAQSVFLIEIVLLLIQKGILTRDEIVKKLRLDLAGARESNSPIAARVYEALIGSLSEQRE